MARTLEALFGTTKPIIGMIHLAGDTPEEITKRALEEIKLYEEEGLSGVIIEDYHGLPRDVKRVCLESAERGFTIARGVNMLFNPYAGFQIANVSGGTFVQFDSVMGNSINREQYSAIRNGYPDIKVLGGVGFKYTQPTGRTLREDLVEGMENAEVIVTTGEGTGLETPLEKLRDYRTLIGDFPLLVGAGVTGENVRDQLQIADGAIVGSFFKCGYTRGKIRRDLVRQFMHNVEHL